MAFPFDPSSLKTKRVLVMGLGRFGGGLGVTRYLLKHSAHVVLNDRASQEELSESLKQLGEHPNLELKLGGHESAYLDDIDLLVVNPAVPRPWDNPFITEASSRSIPITTEIELAYRQLNSQRVIAITGSAGKSTTAAMTHHALGQLGMPSLLGGNIGGTLLGQLDLIMPDTTIVLEVSSAMIHWLWGTGSDDRPPSTAVGCVTSYAPNHIDWHGDESHYHQSKQLLAKGLNPDSTFVTTSALRDWASLTSAQTQLVDQLNAVDGCSVPGSHNAMNAACAVACIQALFPELCVEDIAEAVRSFAGLPHRMNLCFEHDGVMYYDDSKSTTPQATTLALDAIASRVDPGHVHLIAGGYDKGSDLSPIASLAPKLKGLYCIGTVSAELATDPSAYECGTLESAMQMISDRLEHGDVVLLSPGCASWDQFENYEHRGRVFLELARAHAGAKA